MIWAPGEMLIPTDRELRDRAPLTPRMLQVRELLAEGMTNLEIGTVLGISEGMVKQYNKEIFRKLRVTRREEVVVQVWRRRVQDLEARVLDLAELEREFCSRELREYRARVKDNATWLDLGEVLARVDDPRRSPGGTRMTARGTAEWVQSLRLALGLGVGDFAGEVQVFPDRVRGWERGSPPRPVDKDRMIALARREGLELGPDGLWMPPDLVDQDERREWLSRPWAWRAQVQSARAARLQDLRDQADWDKGHAHDAHDAHDVYIKEAG